MKFFNFHLMPYRHANLDAIERHKFDRLIGAPAFYHLLLEASTKSTHDLSSVRSVFSGAAPIDTTTLRRMGETFSNAKVIEGYGLSEATTILTNQQIGRASCRERVSSPV